MGNRRLGACLAMAVVFLSAGQVARGADAAAKEQLHSLLADSWEFALAEDPLFATHVGDSRYNDRLPRETLAHHKRRLAAEQAFLKRLEAIDRDQLDRADQINLDIFGRQKRDAIAEYEFLAHLMPITNRSGFHVSFPELRLHVPLKSLDDYENYVDRLRAFQQYADDHIELMREGIKRGVTLPSVVMVDLDEVLGPHIVDDPTRSMLYEPFKEFPESISPEDRQRLSVAGKAVIAESVVPGYRTLLAFLTAEYVPACRQQVGASALPNGREFYRHRVRHHTTLDIDPQAVHDTGLAEVKRIKAEMQKVIRRTGFEGDFAAFVEFLRTDPKFYANSPEELLKETSLVLKRMDGELPKLFGTLPRTPYGIREIPAFIAPRTTTAYYQPPAGDGSRAGFYYVNTYNLKSRPLYEIEALSLHEAVPGHHIQIAIQQELAEQPPFRRFAHATAFVEGWGLYAERLGLEVGFYQDPYRDFGRLSYEMWRACRLVVDTGMHYLGWTRQQAIEFMADNTALTLHNITAEVDRYIAWPGQATAYKMGELKIRALRRQAEERLGDAFDVRTFHDVVLGDGAVPLDVLEENVRAWIERTATTVARGGDASGPDEQANEADDGPFSPRTAAPRAAEGNMPPPGEMPADIFENPAAEELVREARKFDPLFCPEEQRDRDQAARLYAQAIDAQPGARINAPLANRIAQLYGAYSDPQRNIEPDFEKARHWWHRCLELTNPRQLLWAQAQMGLGGYDAILKMDASRIELDDWKAWPAGDSAEDAAIRQHERERLRRHLVDLQARVVAKKAERARLQAEQGKVVTKTRQPAEPEAPRPSADSDASPR